MRHGSRIPVALAAGTLLLTAPAYAEDIEGDKHANVLQGTSQADLIHGRGGADVLHGRAGPDVLYGDKGADVALGNGGKDTIVTKAKDDANHLGGGRGADRLFPRGDDEVEGGRGDDRIVVAYPGPFMTVDCGPGFDRLTFNEPYDDVQISGCEKVKLVSAG